MAATVSTTRLPFSAWRDKCRMIRAGCCTGYYCEIQKISATIVSLLSHYQKRLKIILWTEGALETDQWRSFWLHENIFENIACRIRSLNTLVASGRSAFDFCFDMRITEQRVNVSTLRTAKKACDFTNGSKSLARENLKRDWNVCRSFWEKYYKAKYSELVSRHITISAIGTCNVQICHFRRHEIVLRVKFPDTRRTWAPLFSQILYCTCTTKWRLK